MAIYFCGPFLINGPQFIHFEEHHAQSCSISNRYNYWRNYEKEIFANYI